MSNKNNQYSLRKDINKKTLVLFDLNRELDVIKKLMPVFSKDEKNEKRDALILRENMIRERQKVLKGVIADMNFFEKIISYCSSGIYLASIINYSVENNNFNKDSLGAVYDKIISLVAKESSNCQSFIDAKFLQFFENTALDYTGDYEPALQKWIQVFYEDNSFVSAMPFNFLLISEKIYKQFNLLRENKFDVCLDEVNNYLSTIINGSSFKLKESNDGYPLFGLYIFTVYKVINRFLKQCSQFSDSDAFMLVIQEQMSNAVDVDIWHQFNELSEGMINLSKRHRDLVNTSQEEISFIHRLISLQKIKNDAESLLKKLEWNASDSPFILRQQSRFGLSKKNIDSLFYVVGCGLLRSHSERWDLKEVSYLQSDNDNLSYEQCMNYLNYFREELNKSKSYLFVDEIAKRNPEIQIFFDYMSYTALPKRLKLKLVLVFYFVQKMSNFILLLHEFMRHLRKEVVVIEKCLVETMVKKGQALQAMQNNAMLCNEVLLFIHVMTDAIPFLSKDNKETIILLRNDWNQRYCSLEKENLPTNVNKTDSTRLEIREEELLLSKPLEKSNFFDSHLPQLRGRLQELSINLYNIEKYRGSYRKKNKGEQFKSALGQTYAAIFDLKKWFNFPSDFSVELILEKINHQLEIALQENKSDLKIDILKKDIQSCFKSIQLVKGILNKLVDRLVELKKEKDVIDLKDIESLSSRLLIKIKAIVKDYHAQKGEFLFLYDLIKLIFVNDWEKYEYSENFTLPFLLEELAAFESIYLALNQNCHFLPRVKTEAEVEKNRSDASEVQALAINESPNREGSTHCKEVEQSTGVELNKGAEDSAFEDWKYKVEGNLRSLEKAITHASDELLVRVSSLFYKILQCFVREIELKQSELIKEDDQRYCSEIRFKVYYYLDYILCRCHSFNYHQSLGPMTHAYNASPLLLQNNYDVDDYADKAELADYLIVAMNINAVEQQILLEEERLFNHSQSFIKPLCQNDSVYTDSFAGLDKRVSEASEQIFKVSQLKRRLGFEKEKKQVVFEQLAKKMDEQSLKRFIKRVDPRENFEFVSSSAVVYLPAITSANFYQLPIASVVDSGYSSHVPSLGSTPS